MTRIKLTYVHQFTDRHGKARHYFRRPGYKRTPLPGLPGSTEFMAAYAAALDHTPRHELGASRTIAGTINSVAVGYLSCAAFHNLAPISQRHYRGIIERIRRDHGDKRVALLERRHVVRMLDAKATMPAAARGFLLCLRALIQYAIDIGLREDNPTVGIRIAKSKTDGFANWSESDIAAFEAVHPIGTKPRLALALLLYTAQRRADVIRMGRQHIRSGVIHTRQQKTGTVLEIPISSELAAILDATPTDNLTFLTAGHGRPFSPEGFSRWFRTRCNEAGLPNRSAHGLRKAACRRLAEAGCSANEIAAISGHASLREVERYTKAADQARMARNALARTRTETSSGKPGGQSGKPGG
jgi:integrase